MRTIYQKVRHGRSTREADSIVAQTSDLRVAAKWMDAADRYGSYYVRVFSAELIDCLTTIHANATEETPPAIRALLKRYYVALDAGLSALAEDQHQEFFDRMNEMGFGPDEDDPMGPDGIMGCTWTNGDW